jgi:hypothetical protein
MLFEAEELGIQLIRGDWIDPGHHCGEDCIKVLIQAGHEIGDQFIIMERSPGGSKIIDAVAHLGITVRDRQLVLLGGGEGDVCVHDMSSHL